MTTASRAARPNRRLRLSQPAGSGACRESAGALPALSVGHCWACAARAGLDDPGGAGCSPTWPAGCCQPGARFLYRWLGWGSIFVVVGARHLGLLVLRRLRCQPLEPVPDPSRQQLPAGALDAGLFALEAGALAAYGAAFGLLGGYSLERAEQGLDGGRIGWGLAELLRVLLSGRLRPGSSIAGCHSAWSVHPGCA